MAAQGPESGERHTVSIGFAAAKLPPLQPSFDYLKKPPLAFNPFSAPRVSSLVEPHLPGLSGRAYRCRCGKPVFFTNSRCLACNTALGYDPHQAQLLPLMPAEEPGTWLAWDHTRASDPSKPLPAAAGRAPSYRRCSNLSTPAACNWLVPTADPYGQNGLCSACRMNRTIPSLRDPQNPDNGFLWGRLERAKRRLVSALMALGLPVGSRLAEDPEHGLMFDFLRSPRLGLHVSTGHHTGLITLNLDEANDATREALRETLREPYRTLLGHFRHEVGHYYWGRLVCGTGWMEGFRRLFGDETADYAGSLRRHYQHGPPAGWQLHFVSAYASMHPWEDWAECWAHYLHIRDTTDTALSFGLRGDHVNLEFTPFTMDALYEPDHPQAERFLAFLNDWTRLTTMLNELSRAMGQPDFYPFVLPREGVAKLHFIHLLVTSASRLPRPGYPLYKMPDDAVQSASPTPAQALSAALDEQPQGQARDCAAAMGTPDNARQAPERLAPSNI